MKIYLRSLLSLFQGTVREQVRTEDNAPEDDPRLERQRKDLDNYDKDVERSAILLPQHDPDPIYEPDPGNNPYPSYDPDPGLEEDEEEGGRQQWGSSTEFLMSCISMSVGLGNVWRFPFTAYENGGGAFLLPYLLVLALIGRPLYLLELGLGQFCSGGCLKVWDLAPAFRGVGVAQLLATCCVVSYYCSLIGLALRYLVASCQAVLPWAVCHLDLAQPDTLCLPSGGNRTELLLISNTTNLTTVVPSAEQFFRVGVLKEPTILDLTQGLGMPDPALAACLAACWLLLFLSLHKGVAGSGKVAYFTALFPYLVMLVLLGRGLTLPGATKGLLFLLTPQWDRLLDPGVWYAAVTQSFFSLGVGFGALSSYSSYNRFHHNSYRDALVISVMDTFTSLLAGTIIFSILGHLSLELGVPVDQVVKSGAGLAFVSYPEVLAKFTVAPQLFAVLFFLMLVTLGLGSATGLLSNVISVVCDLLGPSRPITRTLITGLVCLTGLLVGMVYVTPSGQALLELVDYYGGSLLVLILAWLEVIAVAWVYGATKVREDLSMMLRTNLGSYWSICWSLVIPTSLTAIIAYAIVNHKPVEYSGSALPTLVQCAGWTITGVGLVLVPLVMVYLVCRGEGVGSLFRPSLEWGPSAKEDWAEWRLARVGEWVCTEMVEVKRDTVSLEFNVELELEQDSQSEDDFRIEEE